jgi:hypothetical protein
MPQLQRTISRARLRILARSLLAALLTWGLSAMVPSAPIGQAAGASAPFVAAALSVAATPSLDAAAADEIQITLRAPWEGWYAEGRWMPLWVELRNQGPGRRVRLRARARRASYELSVELPAGAEKRLPLMVYLDASDRQPGRLPVEVIGAEGDLLAETTLTLKALGRRRLSLALLPAAAEVPAGLDEPASLVELLRPRPQDLPEDALGWAAVDRVLLGELRPGEMSEVQREALRQWLALGGHLLLTPGALDDLPEALRPAESGAERMMEGLRSLGALAGDAGPRGRIALNRLDPAAGAVTPLVTDEGLPLALRRPYGDGIVTALAFDPSRAPVATWPGLSALWQSLDRSRPNSAWSEPPPAADWMATGIRPREGSPALGGLLLLLLGYIVLVGPINQALLARRGRPEWAWISIPALALAASLMVLGLGLARRGQALETHQRTVVRVVPEAGLAMVDGYIGLRSPASRRQDLWLERGLALPVARGDGGFAGTIAIQQQGPPGALGSALGGLSLEAESLSGFVLQAVLPWPVASSDEAAEAAPALTPLRREGPALSGSVQNPLGRDLMDAQVLATGGQAGLGNLAADARVAAHLPFDPARPLSLDARGPRGHLLAALLNDGSGPASVYAATFQMRALERPDALLLGWLAEPPLGFRLARFGKDGPAPPDETEEIAAKQGDPPLDAETLAYVHLPVELASAGMLFIDGTATRRATGSAEACDAAAAVLTPEFDFAEFSFPLAEGEPLPYAVWLSLIGPRLEDAGLTGATGPLEIRIALWDPGSEEWLDFERMASGSSLPIPRLITRVDGRDLIRLRLSLDRGRGLRVWEGLRERCWEPRISIARGAATEAEDGG